MVSCIEMAKNALRTSFPVVLTAISKEMVVLGSHDGEWKVELYAPYTAPGVEVATPYRNGVPCREGKALIVEFLRDQLEIPVYYL
jgi:hypothetical protein